MPTVARALCVALCAVVVTFAAADGPADVVIRGIAVVDVVAGRVVPSQDIVIRGPRVVSVEPAGPSVPAAKTLIEGRGKFVMPGLIAAPVRLAAADRDRAQALLASGVTAVRDVGADAQLVEQWRRDLDDGRLWSPRVVAACGSAPANATPFRADAVHDELAGLVATGTHTPAQALRAVTFDRARAWCLEGLGAVAAGGVADLVVLDANPLDDIRHTRAIDAVIFRGGVLSYAHLQLLRRSALPTPTPPRPGAPRRGVRQGF